MSRRKRSHQSPSPSRRHERSVSRSPPKRRKTPDPSPVKDGNTLASILSSLQQIQTDMAKRNDHISIIESRFEDPRGIFPPSHTSDDQRSVLVDSDTELNYDCISSPSDPEHQAVKPSHKAIKPSYTATRPSHQANASQSLERNRLSQVADSNSTTLLYDPDSAQSSWQPQKELSAFLEKQFRRKLSYDQVCEILDAYNIP